MESSVLFVAEIIWGVTFCCFSLIDHMMLLCHWCYYLWPFQSDRDQFHSEICQWTPHTLATGSRRGSCMMVHGLAAFRPGYVVRFPNSVLVTLNRYFVIPAPPPRWPNSRCAPVSSCDTWWPQFYCVHVSDDDDPHPRPLAVTNQKKQISSNLCQTRNS